MNLMNVISPITFANESLSTKSRVAIIITLEFFRWAWGRGWFLSSLSKNWCQGEIRNWRKWTLLFRSFQRRNSMLVSNVSFQLFFRFDGWITLSALEILGDDDGVLGHLRSHQGGSRRLSFLLQKGFPSTCIPPQCWGAWPLSKWFDFTGLLPGIQGEDEGRANVDREGELQTLAGQCLAKIQALSCQRGVVPCHCSHFHIHFWIMKMKKRLLCMLLMLKLL